VIGLLVKISVVGPSSYVGERTAADQRGACACTSPHLAVRETTTTTDQCSSAEEHETMCHDQRRSRMIVVSGTEHSQRPSQETRIEGGAGEAYVSNCADTQGGDACRLAFVVGEAWPEILSIAMWKRT
jgi:hypothetical protein